MAVIEGGGSGTGGGSSSISGLGCFIGGADESGELLSLQQRVARIEAQITLLLGGNVSAAQLSDLSQQVGWVTGITYMGQPGWTRTEYGTLIPPAGWTLSLPALLPGGAQVSGTNPFAYLKSTDNLIDFGAAPDNGSATWEISKDDTSLVSLFGSTGFKVSTSGFYLVSLAVGVSTDNAADGHALVQCNFSPQGDEAQDIDGNRNIGPRIYVALSTAIGPASATYTSSRFMYVDAGATGTCQAFSQGVGLSVGIGSATVSLMLVQAEQLDV